MTILDDFKLDERVALVTGAARGLGQGIAFGLAEAGADVAVLDLLPLDETRETISTQGRRCHTLNFDLRGTKAAQARKIVGECVEALGRLDILVNNAGLIRRSSAIEFGEEEWEEVISVNLSSAFYLSQAAARHFVQEGRGGKIIDLASVLSFQGGAPSAVLRRVQGCTRQPHSGALERVGEPRNKRQRNSPKLLLDRDDRRAAG